MARPLPKLDLVLVAKLAAIDCTDSEIASALGLTPERFCKRKGAECDLQQVLEEGHAAARRSLRRLQWETANKGSVAMQIWLGKQMLGQSDLQRVKLSQDENGLPLIPEGVLARLAGAGRGVKEAEG